MSFDVEPRNLRGQDQSDVHLLRVDEAEADAAKYLSVWVGKSNLMKRGLCTMGLQIEESHDPNHPFTGFSRLACAPTMFEILGKAQHDKTRPGTIDKISKNSNPVSTILIGTLKNGAVTLEPHQTFGLKEVDHDCPMSLLTVTPFSIELAGDWKENDQDECQGGQLMLDRVTR